MEPVFHIPLSDEQLIALGEICAIQGQIDYIMQLTVENALNIKAGTARAVLGSSGLKTNIELWAQIMRDKLTDRMALSLVDLVVKDAEFLAPGRNDFVHAFFAEITPNGGIRLSGGVDRKTVVPKLTRPVMAVRTRNQQKRAAADLSKVRDIAARITHCLWKIFMTPPPAALLGKPEPKPHPQSESG